MIVGVCVGIGVGVRNNKRVVQAWRWYTRDMNNRTVIAAFASLAFSWAACGDEPGVDPQPDANTTDAPSPWACEPTGGAPEVISSTMNQPNAYVFAGDMVYFSDYFTDLADGGGRVYAAPATGGPAEILYEVPITVDFGGLGVLAADADHLYWVESFTDVDPDADEKRIVRLSLTAPDAMPEELWRMANAGGILADDSHFYIGYEEASERRLARLPRAGGALEQLGVIPTQPRIMDQDHVYGVGFDGIWQVAKQGGAVATFVGNTYVTAIDVSDPDDIYFYASDSGTLSRIAKTGGSPEVLYTVAEPTWWISAIAVDTDHVFFTRSEYTIEKLPKSGGPPEDVVCHDQTGFSAGLRVDDTYLYWLHDRDDLDPGIMRARKSP